MAKYKYWRLEAVANGATINGTYKLPVGKALEAFRAELKAIIQDNRNGA